MICSDSLTDTAVRQRDVRRAGVKRVDAKEHKRIDREIRRLNAEFGMHSGRQAATAVTRVALILAAIAGVAMVLYMPTAPSERAVGRVDGISLRETDTGTRLLARVTVGTAQGLVRLPRGAMCLAGDRIDLVKRKTLLNVRYTTGIRGCMRRG